uniref:Uncharacterized protein n=1 Tax=Anguilla anguilla TaxID=7936 RepID=A0A0E9SM45_ANGAN
MKYIAVLDTNYISSSDIDTAKFHNIRSNVLQLRNGGKRLAPHSFLCLH